MIFERAIANAVATFTEPTTEETKAALAKEKSEQDALPYKWTQTIGDVDITITGIPGNYKGKDLSIDIKKQKLVVGVKGQEPFVNVRYCFCRKRARASKAERREASSGLY